MTKQEVFTADLNRMNAQFVKLGAVVTYKGGWQGIDEMRVPLRMLTAYRRLVQYGYANGLI